MDPRPAVISPTWWIVALVFAAVAAGVVAMSLNDRAGVDGSDLGDRFEYQIDRYRRIDPSWIRWHETSSFDAQVGTGRAIAVGPDDRVYVGGEKAIHVFDRSGALCSRIALKSAAYSLAVAGPGHAAAGRVYVGLKDHVEAWNPDGTPLGAWESLGPRAVLTSIALSGDEVFVADAGSQTVHRLDAQGKPLGRIGQRDRHGSGGFVVPSPFFDVAAAPGGSLYVANPGALRVETHTADGKLRFFWGESSAEIEGFFGCCNPANLAVLPDGRIVTAEKGLLRVKVYTPDGTLDGVVAGPEQLDSAAPVAGQGLADREFTAVDVAADSRGRVLVLDRATGVVRVFEEKRSQEGGGQ